MLYLQLWLWILKTWCMPQMFIFFQNLWLVRLMSWSVSSSLVYVSYSSIAGPVWSGPVWSWLAPAGKAKQKSPSDDQLINRTSHKFWKSFKFHFNFKLIWKRLSKDNHINPHLINQLIPWYKVSKLNNTKNQNNQIELILGSHVYCNQKNVTTMPWNCACNKRWKYSKSLMVVSKLDLY